MSIIMYTIVMLAMLAALPYITCVILAVLWAIYGQAATIVKHIKSYITPNR